MKKKYLISGYAPSPGGVGRLVNNLLPEAKKRGYTIVLKRRGKSAKLLYSKKKFFSLALEMIKRVIDNFHFGIKCRSIKDSVVLFIHPQKTGYRNLLSLSRNNELYLYVVDNGFFCIRSYNNDPVHEMECTECLGNIGNYMKGCRPFPIKMNTKRNIEFLQRLKEISDKIFFLTQNRNQSLLIKRHFGDEINCKVVGLDTGELEDYNKLELDPDLSKSRYIVYHGSLKVAKGIKFFLHLTRELENYNFFIPYSKEKVEKEFSLSGIKKNVLFQDATWESGLKDYVINAILVVNPSLWSAPIEGALMKSICFNGNVATVKTSYGFEEELKHYSGILRLNPDYKIASKQINDYIKNNSKAYKTDNNKLKNKISIMNINNIFSVINTEKT